MHQKLVQQVCVPSRQAAAIECSFRGCVLQNRPTSSGPWLKRRRGQHVFERQGCGPPRPEGAGLSTLWPRQPARAALQVKQNCQGLMLPCWRCTQIAHAQHHDCNLGPARLSHAVTNPSISWLLTTSRCQTPSQLRQVHILHDTQWAAVEGEDM